MQIIRLEALSDNYVFLLYDRKQNIAAVVDPAETEPILTKLNQLQAKLVAIFNTHHHRDHVGGNTQLIQRFPQVQVYGGIEDRGRIPGQQIFLQQGDRVQFADRSGEVIFVPGHTRAHIAYYFPSQSPNQPGELFCGDTLFAGGCGRLFEGTPTQMVDSLNKLKDLPDNTRIWCAHEYTFKNLQFALTVDVKNTDLQNRYEQVKLCRTQGEATIPSLLGIEKRTNPFLRYTEPELQSTVNSDNPVQTFARLRGMKDRF